MRFAVVGTGMMGCEHIRNLVHMDDVELVAISDPNERSRQWALQACGDRFQPQLHADHKALKTLSLDAVIIASPNHTHIEVVRDLADTPFHLLLEKPMCTTLADSRELVKLSDERTALTWIALEYRYMSATQSFLQRLEDVGDLKMLFIREHRFPFLEKVDHWNRFNSNTGGTLVEKCCHFFDLMNLAANATPLRVMASGAQDVNHLDERYEGKVPDILDNAFVIVEYSSGVRACLDLCMFAEGSRNEQELVATGSTAKLEVHIPDNRMVFSPRTDADPHEITVPHDNDIRYMGYHHGASYLEIRDFISAIERQRPATVTTRDGFSAVAIGLAAQSSIQEGRFVDVESC